MLSKSYRLSEKELNNVTGGTEEQIVELAQVIAPHCEDIKKKLDAYNAVINSHRQDKWWDSIVNLANAVDSYMNNNTTIQTTTWTNCRNSYMENGAKTSHVYVMNYLKYFYL